ncbi:MAG: energy transducer TonB [Proteiniphilum sp.]|nr:energy transducer TonB [Proteiniphilum sp.]
MNIRKFLFVFAVSVLVWSFAAKQSIVTAQEAPLSNSNRIVRDPDVMPVYPGGTPELHRFISGTLKYPDEAKERNIQGLVVYTFVVEKDGSLSNFKIIHRADSLLNGEALRILQAMPRWRPARHKGLTVRSETYVPMYFRLNQNAGAVAGSPVQPVRDYSKTDPGVVENNIIYTIVDRMPQYVYGESGLSAFIAHNLRYPVKALQDGIEGRILCSFIVAGDGSISNIEVVEGSDELLNAEAVRVLGLMPKWIPGENNGEKVHVKCLLPVDFVIDEDPIPPFPPGGTVTEKKW